LLQPAFFQRNLPPRFTGSTRKWDLYFDYGWSEDDEVTIDLPEGWELDQPMAPVSTNLGEVGKYAVEVRKTRDGKKLIYRRQFEWGRQNRLLLAAKAYPQVKAVFDFVQEQDGYTIALKAAGDGR
jgi:Cu/Ag efflux pump CusA